MRFVNWLDNGQPIGLQSASTTETGSYSLIGLDAGTQTLAQIKPRRANANYVLPSLNEWYKAAFYNPSTYSYFIWATGTNAKPGDSLPDTTGNNANDNNANNDGLLRSPVCVLRSNPQPVRGIRHGWRCVSNDRFSRRHFPLRHPGRRYPGNYGFNSQATLIAATGDSPMMGLRIAEVQEPSSIGLLCLGSVALMARRPFSQPKKK